MADQNTNESAMLPGQVTLLLKRLQAAMGEYERASGNSVLRAEEPNIDEDNVFGVLLIFAKEPLLEQLSSFLPAPFRFSGFHDRSKPKEVWIIASLFLLES